MSTILDALRRLQTERASGPVADPREALSGRVVVASRRVALRGIGLGAVLGAATVALLAALWLLSGAVFPSTAAEPPPEPAPQRSAAAAPPAAPPATLVRADGPPPQGSAPEPAQAAEPAAPRAPAAAPAPPAAPAPVAPEPASPEPAAPEPPRAPLSKRRLQRVQVAQNERTGGSEQRLRRTPAPRQADSSGEIPSFSAIAERRPESKQPPAPPAPPAKRSARPSRKGAPPRDRAAARPRPATPRGAGPAAAPSALTPGHPSASEPPYVDPVVFPALSVRSVRWHPDPARRQATVEVDGVVAIAAREGEKVGGAFLTKIDPGQVEFRVGTRTKIVRLGK